MEKQPIILKKVRVHNLKSVDLELTTNEFIVFTGVSGSGKSSLAFDTLFVEGQRRYIESLSTYARRYIGEMEKPDLDFVSGLSPTISIEQKSAGKNPRSIVATMTEIYDYLRVLYARVGIPHCPISGEVVLPQSKERIIRTLQMLPEKTKIVIYAPFIRSKKGEFKEEFATLLRKGFTKSRVDGTLVDLSEKLSLDKRVTHTVEVLIDRLTVEKENLSRIAEGVISALTIGEGTLLLENLTRKEETLFSTQAFSPKSGLSYPSLEPHDFSFNSPSGMCKECHGIGQTQEFDLDKIIDPEKSIAEDCCSIASSYQTVRYSNIYNNLATLFGFKVDTPWKKLPEKARHIFLFGTEKRWTSMHFVHPKRPISWTEYVAWRGVVHEAKERYANAKSDLYRKKVEELMKIQLCPFCKGSKLKPYPAAATVAGKKIHEVIALTIEKALHFFTTLTLDKSEKIIAEELLKEITRRLQFLVDVGLGYLTLDRTSPTLSGGESQRVRLASQVGAGLVGVTYVLDEPSIGLHPRDNERLIGTLKNLRDRGNTVIVVEHDEETILAADRVVDFGPGAGKKGGEILYNGNVQGLLKDPKSLTGAYLAGKEEIEIPEKRRQPKEFLTIEKAAHNNLKNIDVAFPLGLFVAVTGVSGSGKSSLITDILYPALANHLHNAKLSCGKHKAILGLDKVDKVIAIDQSAIGRNPRSNPATYIKIFDEIRTLFSELPESRARGFLPGRFSFNVKEGSCSECRGLGVVKVNMDFMEDLFLPCPLCKNQRFDPETLSIYYKGKNIYEILEMTVQEALSLFHPIPSIREKLEVVEKVGMGYITLGQSSTTLSGGEAQRVKLAKELVRPASGKTIYILDEPTTGLHFHDTKALLHVLEELVERGNTVIVIEHNMEVVKRADWIIDLGPEGGEKGGEIIAKASPEKIAAMKTPTGIALRKVLKKEKREFKERRIKERGREVESITVVGASQNNLKSVDLTIPRGKMTICTGPSGSGKSSLAFDTVYAEGQRRYIESLTPYARQFVQQMAKPKLTSIEGLSPAVAIEQKATSGNPRSTLGTMTEIYDYLRVLYTHLGIPHDPETKEVIRSITKEMVVEKILKLPAKEQITILAPLELNKGEKFEDLTLRYTSKGFLRLRLNGEIYEMDQPIPFDRKRKNEIALLIDRVRVEKGSEKRIADAVEQAVSISKQKVLLLRQEGKEELYNLAFAVERTGRSFAEISPHTFSFNSPEGMCLECEGLGYLFGAHFTHKPEIMALSSFELFSIFFAGALPDILKTLFKEEKIDPTKPLAELSPAALSLILNGSSKWYKAKGFNYQWQGVQPILAKAAKGARREIRFPLLPLLDEVECKACKGSRLNPLARNVTLSDLSIADLSALSVSKIYEFIDTLKVEKKKQKILSEVIRQIKGRLSFLLEVGLHYVSLDRKANTLSNGETQRIRLARQLGSRLTGVLYVLDEPTVGLHPHDNARLNRALKELKELGNTLLLVEHDPMTVKEADYLFDFGPGAGLHGGQLMAEGTLKEIMANPHSLTGAYLSGKKKIEIPKKRREAKGFFEIKNGHIHNLKNLDLSLPIGTLTCLTGVSGSGKSTLLHSVIRPQVEATLISQNPFDKLIVIDQNPIGHTVRSDLGTYIDLLPPLRNFFASLADARTRGLQPKHFSYNHRKGMCTHCYGLGYKRVDLLFLPSVKVICEECHGLRLNPLSLEVNYQGKNFGQLFEMSVEEIRAQFEFIPKVRRLADTLISVGLSYLTLGQEIQTLSAGEAQRMKLARELARRQTGKTLYLLDEPTTGQHPDDIKKLLALLDKLIDKGNTMVIIEHNLDVIKCADYLFDLGPEGGEEGGYLVAQGSPEEVAAHPTSYTAKYLKEVLKKK